jgi:hypothetical protein
MFSFKYIVLKSDRPRAQYTIRLCSKENNNNSNKERVESKDFETYNHIATFPHKNVHFTTLK